ncbi:AraC family transcriptional regulator [Marinobacter sp. SS21]|uniref:AraC family transcriptional regulator n=1 Tax=Marinobacter sp. SS21 TaxID=2979460 RepID=UPI00232D1FF9|nr:AraC family transcriptional regulator [Marinobacter sp. SS21]MDC0661450.1 AraC family transcriptional regulator [Marinobacter sp. SS21]
MESSYDESTENSRTVRAGLVRHLIASAVASGLAIDQIMDTAHLNLESLADPNGRVPVATLEHLVCAATATSQDPLLGLHMSEQADATDFGVVGHLRLACGTLREIIDMTMRYERLVGDFGLTSLSYGPGSVLWCWDCLSDNPLFRRQATEYIMGCWLSIHLGMLQQLPPPLLAVHFQHGPPSDPGLLTEYQRIFGCPVHFSQRESALALPIDALKRPLSHPDSELQGVLESHARILIEQQSQADTFINRARTQLRALLRQGDASKDSLASALGISSRHLHRQLRRENFSYQQLVNELRLELARLYLANGSDSIEAVAFRLKFSESQSFIRWFRKMAGVTPGQYRKSIQN